LKSTRGIRISKPEALCKVHIRGAGNDLPGAREENAHNNVTPQRTQRALISATICIINPFGLYAEYKTQANHIFITALMQLALDEDRLFILPSAAASHETRNRPTEHKWHSLCVCCMRTSQHQDPNTIFYVMPFHTHARGDVHDAAAVARDRIVAEMAYA
jgi:hypothetical protein